MAKSAKKKEEKERGAGDLATQIRRLESGDGTTAADISRAKELHKSESAIAIRLAALYVRRDSKPEAGLTARESAFYAEMKELDADAAEAWKTKKLAEKSKAKK